jgi:hypothetical protein
MRNRTHIFNISVWGALAFMLVCVLADNVSAQAVSFIARRDFESGAHPQSVAVGDFNRDGIQDLAVANFFPPQVAVLLGNPDGTFQVSVKFDAGSESAESVAVGDFNHDGIQDLAVANLRGYSILGNGDGTFLPARSVAAGTNISTIAIGDFNRDGIQDLAMPDFLISVPGQPGVVLTLLGNGDGTFQAMAFKIWPQQQLVCPSYLAMATGRFSRRELSGRGQEPTSWLSATLTAMGNLIWPSLTKSQTMYLYCSAMATGRFSSHRTWAPGPLPPRLPLVISIAMGDSIWPSLTKSQTMYLYCSAMATGRFNRHRTWELGPLPRRLPLVISTAMGFKIWQ